jgi:glycosyltransferase involved in cell wall biosynthesis
LYKGLFPYLESRGWSITTVVGDREYTDFPKSDFGALRPVVIPMNRLPSPIHDIFALLRFLLFFIRNRYDVIHVSTPKAALLASIAARMTANGRVVFVYRRCVYEMMTGLKRTIFRTTDKITCACSDVVIPISYQISRFLEEERICDPRKRLFIGIGSSNGVDVRRYQHSEEGNRHSQALRRELNIPLDAPVLLFIGRLCSEKGVDLLPRIFDLIEKQAPNVHLVVAGPDDIRDPIAPATKAFLERRRSVRHLGFIVDTVPYYELCSVFVFPSFFEGFGNVLLEAAAMSRTAVGFNVPGVQEAIEDTVSGFLVPAGDLEAFANAVVKLLQCHELRQMMEWQARLRVVRSFDRAKVWHELEGVLARAGTSRAGGLTCL